MEKHYAGRVTEILRHAMLAAQAEADARRQSTKMSAEELQAYADEGWLKVEIMISELLTRLGI